MIIDCFPFFDELDVLEIRLNELKDVVDVHVLSEATLTFTGKFKPLYFDENKDRFKEFNIHHVIISDYSSMSISSPRSMDRGQKQLGIDAAMELDPDILILSDADEIPKAEKVLEASGDDWDAAMIEMRLYYYFMNCRCKGRPGSWRNPRMVRPKGKIPHYNSTRNKGSDKDYWDAGWHFSFLGDIKYKIDSWTHAPEFNKPPYNTEEHIRKCVAEAKDLFNRDRYQYEFVYNLDYLPRYVKDNMEKFERFIYNNPS